MTGTGAEGLNMRANPSRSAARVKTIREGSELEIVGEDRQGDGRAWRNIRDASDGAVGWAAAEFLAAAGVPAPAPNLTPKSAGLSQETRAYLDWANPRVRLAGETLKTLVAQADQAGDNPRLLSNNDWRIKTAATLAVMDATGKELQAYPGTVPTQARKLDGIVRDTGRDLVYIAVELTAGTDQASYARIKNASAGMARVRATSQAATAEIQAITGQ